MKPYTRVTITAPTVEPVTLAQAKEQLRLTSSFTSDDAYITALIPVARDRCESYCNRYFTEQVVTLIWEQSFPVGDFLLPYPDLHSVDSITYTDTRDAVHTINPLDYSFDAQRQVLIPASDWPSDAKSIKVTITTGPPVELKGVTQAILMIVTDMYELRTESVVGVSIAENPAVKALLYPYRVNLGV